MKALDPAKLKEKIHFQPHLAQQEILAKMKRFTIICCGRRFGKTLLASYLALKKGLLNNKNVWIVAPSYDLSKKAFDYLTLWVGNYFPKGAFKVNFSMVRKFASLFSRLLLIWHSVSLILSCIFSPFSRYVLEA